MMHEDWRRLTHEVLVFLYYKEDGQTGHDNSECEYSSWLENSDVDNEESPSSHTLSDMLRGVSWTTSL
jgi:hypothetical protein